VIRKNWRDPHFWRWWWRYRASLDVKLFLGALGLIVVAAVGYVTAHDYASADSGLDSYATTSRSEVTVQGQTRTVVRTVPVVHTARADLHTSASVTVTRDLIRPVVRLRSVTDRETRTSLVTNRITVTENHTVTASRPVTVEHTVTVTQPVTVTSLSTETVTVPLVIVTVTVPVP
jgi:hypothetical protein